MAPRESINNFLFTLFGFQKPKSKAHIALIVMIHAAGWCILFLLPLLFYPVRVTGSGSAAGGRFLFREFIDRSFMMREIVDKAFLVGFFYLNYYYLIPALFEKRKRAAYSLFVLLAFCIYLVQHIAIRNHNMQYARKSLRLAGLQPPPPPLSGAAPSDNIAFGPVLSIRDSTTNVMVGMLRRQEHTFLGIPLGIIMISLSNTISSFMLLLLMGGFIRLAFSFIKNQNEKKALENANLDAEVRFLKSQINPHFLFNTLNSIYSLANARSERTQQAILKLSDMLRFVLYESGTEKIDLGKDIEYISNYIHLQRLRVAQKVKINYRVQGKTKGLSIAPLLLISFIENTFKHGISYMNPSTIDINIDVFDETLTLTASNTVYENNNFESGGIGLKNAKRRLDLLYPGNYILDISKNESLYVVNLKIYLKSD